jgi:hypothetical protein
MSGGCERLDIAGLPSVSTVVAPVGPSEASLCYSGSVWWGVGGGEQAAEGVSVCPVEG